MLLKVPKELVLEPFPECFSPAVNGKIINGQLRCKNEGSVIRISGVEGELVAL